MLLKLSNRMTHFYVTVNRLLVYTGSVGRRMNDDDLTPYQRGNRDGLISFSKFAFEMYELHMKDAEKQELLACKNGMLERANIRSLIIGIRYRANAWKQASERALKMSFALPLDPIGEEDER